MTVGAPRVSVIGSCRAYMPLEAAAGNAIRLAHGRTRWFTHSSKDALQKVSIVNDELRLEPAMVPLIVNARRQYHPATHRAGFFAGTDVFVVEICSAKVFELEGLYLQQRCVGRALAGLYGAEAKAKAQAAHAKVQDEAEIVADVEALAARLERPIVLVPHNQLLTRAGDVPPARLRIAQALEAAERVVPRVTVFDPTPVILAFGRKAAMQDRAHYTRAFLRHLGKRMIQHIEALA